MLKRSENVCLVGNHMTPLNVDYFRIVMRLGQTIPRVDVVRINGVYQLHYGYADSLINYGGHSRSRASLHEGLPLFCRVYENHGRDPSRRQNEFGDLSPLVFVKISSLPIGPFRASEDGRFRLRRNLTHLPPKELKEFLEKHDLVISGDYVFTQAEIEEMRRNPPPF